MLAAFLTSAQTELAGYAIELNEKLGGRNVLAFYREHLEKILNTLYGFSEAIKVEVGYELNLDDSYPKEQIEHALYVLRGEPTSWEAPEHEYAFNEYLLKNYPMFSVVPVINTGIDASEENHLRKLRLGTLSGKQNQQENQQNTVRAEGTGRKHYTVFVSSTFEDMRDIRAAVLGRLYSTEDFMPIGMENFMASDSNQLDYIRERLNDTDIYVLLLGGRYGTLTPRGDRSYTHEEYEMAKANPDVRVLSFVCDHPENLPGERRWRNDDEHDRLMEFTKEVESNKMVRTWAVNTDPERIAGDVYQSLVDETKKGTMRGWTRGEWPEPEQ